MPRAHLILQAIGFTLFMTQADAGEMRTFHDSGSCGLEKFAKDSWTMAMSGEIADQNFVTVPEDSNPEQYKFEHQGMTYRASISCFSKLKKVLSKEEEENRKNLFFGFSSGTSYVTGQQARGWTEDLGIGTKTAGEFTSKTGFRGTIGLNLQKTYGIYISFNRDLANQDYRWDLTGPAPYIGKFSGVVNFKLDSFSLGAQAILGKNRFRPITHLAVGYSIVTAVANIPDVTNHTEQGTGLNIDIGGGVLFRILPHLFVDLQAGFTYCDIPEMTFIASDVSSEVGRKYNSVIDYNRLSASLGLRVEL
jgi:hypothetical protein